MSTLQIGLLIIGLILVIAVYGYNVMQERRIRKRMDDAFKTTADPLLDPPPPQATQSPAAGRGETRERIEPGFAAGGLAGGAGGSAGHGGDEIPVMTSVVEQPVPADVVLEQPPAERDSPPLATEPAGGELPDTDIECVARLQAVQPIPGIVLIDMVEARYPKPCRWVGRQVNGVWTAVRGNDAFTEVAACMVLADRSGALDEHGYNTFRTWIEELAQAIPAACVIGERKEELERAAALDTFCADVDVQIGLNLQRRDGGRWTGTRLRGVAEASGFKLNGNGQLDYINEDGVLLFRMQNREDQPLLAESMKLLSTGGITLLLDVPRAADPVKLYDQMRALAKRLSVTLDAELVDDNSRPLTDAGLGTIRSQLQTVAATMRAKGIEPGGSRALRLFN